jgi:hypothetical protein
MKTILIAIVLLTLTVACRDASSEDNQVKPTTHKSLQDKILDTTSVRMALKQHLELIKEFNDI